MRNIFGLGGLAMMGLVAMAPPPGVAAMHHATGSFAVKISPVAEDGADGVALGRLLVEKTFSGPLAASSRGEMLTAGGTVKGSAAYVLIEQVRGTLDGKAGSFALAHIGVMDRGKPDLRIVIVPDSGTGALAGITGTLAIRIEGGAHFYDLDYRIAPR